MARQADFICDAPYTDFAAVTASDSVVQGDHDAIYVGVSGDIACTDHRGAAFTIKAAPVGILPIRVRLIKSTGTTATNMLLLKY